EDVDETTVGRSPLEDIDAWPTQSLSDDDMSDLAGDQHTRIGAPPFKEEAKRPDSKVSLPPPSQAVRGIVWRGAGGLHLAPYGTKVSAITVEALLVALDPGADLASWLVKG